MLQLKSITKTYTTADFTQTALDGLSVTFRDNEFAAILGPSGSGKTTLLNIIGGLDRADSGELVIDGVSTLKYKDRDWDTYRNNRIGFVFQSYNLIGHQTVLANVELALTLSGVSKAERQQRAKQVLDEVGLIDHINKRPNQLSGGQMQRVAIARALVNNPEILLADEPTGALDSTTSLQIMELLERIAKDRLVIMVTHNPNLADTYATRIVNLIDGKVVSDSDPYEPGLAAVSFDKPIRRSSMSFLTSLSLSFSNLMTKKGRTLMTAFAGSIGIIGIAAILALANGVNEYIKDVEESTLSQYPLTITSQGMDLTSLLVGPSYSDEDEDAPERLITVTGGGEGYIREINILSSIFQSVQTNDLESLKRFLDDPDNEIWQNVNAIEYSYDVTPQVYLGDTSNGVHQVNPGPISQMYASSGMMGSSAASSFGMNMSIFSAMPRNQDLFTPHYNVLAGRWPEKYNEVVLVVVGRNLTSDLVTYTLGLRDPAELQQMLEDFMAQKDVQLPSNEISFSYEDIMAVDLRLVFAPDYYSYDETYEIYVDHRKDDHYLSALVERSEQLHIVGIISSSPDTDLSPLAPGINYSPLLVEYLMDKSAASPLVQAQLADSEIDIFSGKTFEEANRERSSDFDMSKLLTVDEDAISNAFSFDTSALSGLDMSSLSSSFSMNMNFTTIPTPNVPPLDLTALFADVELSDIPMDGLVDFGVVVLSDYLTDRQAELGALGQDILIDFGSYLQTPSGQYLLGQALTYSIDYAQMNALVTWMVTEFTSYCVTNSIPAADMPAAFPIWMSDPLIFGQVMMRLDSAVDQDVLAAYMIVLIGDYLANGNYDLQDISDEVGASFSDWIAEPAVQARVMYYFSQYVDLTPLINKISIGLSNYMMNIMVTFMTQFMASLQGQITSGMGSMMSQFSSGLAGAFSFDTEAFSGAFQFNMTEEDLTQIILSMMGSSQKTYASNLQLLGYADHDIPSSISIYPIDFDSKQAVIDILDAYNQRMESTGQKEKVIIYSDIVGALMSSVTTIIDMISAVLVAFVAISLIVSSIMIGIVTYISVLERKKEIGILRSIGASKRDVGNVFNAETLIIGLTAGVLGIGFTALACYPANWIVKAAIDVDNIAQLPLMPSLVLIGISCALSFFAGLIPSAAASRRDPVEALRSE